MATDPRSLYKTDPTGETARARRMAEQYGFPYVDLEHFQIDHELFRTVPLDLMIRYQFLPEKRENGHIAVVVGDPTDVLKLDELELLLGAPLKVKVASPAAIRDKLSPCEILLLAETEFPQYTRPQLATWIERFFRLWSRNQWNRERYAPSFHLDDENLDPKTWCRFPILSGGYDRELAELKKLAGG